MATAFQRNAFQLDAFQSSSAAFQKCAFQYEGFQTDRCPGPLPPPHPLGPPGWHRGHSKAHYKRKHEDDFLVMALAKFVTEDITWRLSNRH